MLILENKTPKIKKSFWCVYSHFNKNNQVENYVFEALKILNQSGFEIVFVSTSNINSSDDLIKLRAVCNTVISRKNEGYDFGSYKIGIKHITENNFKPKKILITNDSVYGPFKNIKKFIKKSNAFDIYGLTDSIDFNYHLQSFFIIYNEKTINHIAFKKFWNSVRLITNDTPDFKNKIIRDYEVGGSQHFIKYGLKIGAEYGFDKIAKHIFKRFISELNLKKNLHNSKIEKFFLGHNSTHNYWKELLEIGFPYIKRELLTQNPTNSKINDWATIINQLFEYNSQPIAESLYNYANSNDFMYTSNESKYIVTRHTNNGHFNLAINPHLKKFQKIFKAEKVKLFKFDENFYLNNNLDVKASIEDGITTSGVVHFVKYGHMEKRMIRLISIPLSQSKKDSNSILQAAGL